MQRLPCRWHLLAPLEDQAAQAHLKLLVGRRKCRDERGEASALDEDLARLDILLERAQQRRARVLEARLALRAFNTQQIDQDLDASLGPQLLCRVRVEHQVVERAERVLAHLGLAHDRVGRRRRHDLIEQLPEQPRIRELRAAAAGRGAHVHQHTRGGSLDSGVLMEEEHAQLWQRSERQQRVGVRLSDRQVEQRIRRVDDDQRER